MNISFALRLCLVYAMTAEISLANDEGSASRPEGSALDSFKSAALEREEAFSQLNGKWSRELLTPAGSRGLRDEEPFPKEPLSTILSESISLSNDRIRFTTPLLDYQIMSQGGRLRELVSTWNGQSSMSLTTGSSISESYGNIYESEAYKDEEHLYTLPARLLARTTRTIFKSGMAEVVEDAPHRLRFQVRHGNVTREFEANPLDHYLVKAFKETYSGSDAEIRCSIEYNHGESIEERVPHRWSVEWRGRNGKLKEASTVAEVAWSIPQSVDDSLYTIAFPEGVRVYVEASSQMHVAKSDGLLSPELEDQLDGINESETQGRLFSVLLVTNGLIVAFIAMFLWRRMSASNQ